MESLWLLLDVCPVSLSQDPLDATAEREKERILTAMYRSGWARGSAEDARRGLLDLLFGAAMCI